MKHKKQRLKAMGATAIILASSMASEAGKVSMNLNGVPQGDFNVNRTSAASSGTRSAVQIYMLNGKPQGGAGTSSATLSRTASTNQAIALYNLGQEQAASKQFEASLNSFDESLLANPEYADAHHEKGYSLTKLKRHEEAVKSFDEAIKYKSDFAMCHYNRACALQDLGKIEEAREGFKVAVGLNPELRIQSRASEMLQEKQDIATSEPTISVNVEQSELNRIPQSARYEETAKSLQQKKLSIIYANSSELGHMFASAGDYIRNGKTEDAVFQIDRTLERLHDYSSLGVNETRDVMTQTTLSMLRESEISTQTEYECKEIGVQVSSSMALASTQTESMPTSTSFAQTDSSTIGASEIATQTHIVSSNQETQTLASQLNDSFSQTESNQEQIKQTEIGTSTDDLFELENSFNDKRIEEWDLESQSSLEANSWDLDSEVSMASSSLADTEAEQSDASTKIGDGASLALTQQSLSESSTDLEATATSSIQGESSSITYASNLATNEEFSSEVSTKEVQEQNSEETDSIQKEKALHLKEELRQSEEAELRLRKQEEVTKVLEETSKAGATLASTSSGVATNIINSISQRFNLNSIAVAASGDEEEQATLIEPHTGFYISPFVSKTNAKEFGSTSGFNGRSRGYTVGFDSRVNDLLLLGMSYTKADSHINFKQNHLGDKALIDSNFYSLYGQLMPHHQKYFLSTIAIYGKSDISSKACRGSRGTALGRHKAYSNILEVLAGSSQRILQAFSVTEQLGLKYSRTKDATYTERVAVGTPSLSVGRAKSKDFEAIAGLKIDYRYNLSRDITLIPEIYGFASKAINSKAPVIRTKLLVADDIVAVPDIRATRSKLDLSYGASVGIRAKNVDISAGYHAVKARRLMSHAGSLKVKINL